MIEAWQTAMVVSPWDVVLRPLLMASLFEFEADRLGTPRGWSLSPTDLVLVASLIEFEADRLGTPRGWGLTPTNSILMTDQKSKTVPLVSLLVHLTLKSVALAVWVMTKPALVGKMTAELVAMANPDQQSLAQLQASCLEVPMQIQQALKKA